MRDALSQRRIIVAIRSSQYVVTRPLLCFALLCASTLVDAAEIHKCATPTGIAYQGTPCNGAELPPPVVGASAAERRPPISAADGAASRGAPPCDARLREPRRLPWRQATLCIGMTDDEVLNLPGWGRPAKIARTRAPREWREEWSYDTHLYGPRVLRFVNGKLAEVEREFVETGPGPTARLASN